MPLEDWIQHWRLVLYHWQTFATGILAVLAAAGTIWATISSANREIAASQAQTDVAQKQIDTTLRLERRRVASERYAFHAMLAAAMTRVLDESAFAKKVMPNPALLLGAPFNKSAFPELRAACVSHGSRLTEKFLKLENDIDRFVLHWQRDSDADLDARLAAIDDTAKHLLGEAAAEMKQADTVIAETEVPHA